MTKTALRPKRKIWHARADDDLMSMWGSESYTLANICSKLDCTEMQVRSRANRLGLGMRPSKQVQKNSASHYSLKGQRPANVTSDCGSREWFEQNNKSYVQSVLRVHPEREVELRRHPVE